MRQRPLTRFEALAQKLVEGSFRRLFGERLEPYEIASQLARAMEDNVADGLAPNLYQVRLAMTDRKALLDRYPALPKQLADYLTELAQQAGFSVAAAILVQFEADSTMSPQQFQVQASHSAHSDEQTTQIQQRGAAAKSLAALRAVDAYLVIGGRRHVALDRPVVSIGRRRDNDIVLNSPTVSRKHAQVRWRYGRFVLYDLSRRGRTAVNDQAVTEHVLRPGDVIALSGTLLVYGEDQATDRRPPLPDDDDDDQTRPLPKP